MPFFFELTLCGYSVRGVPRNFDSSKVYRGLPVYPPCLPKVRTREKPKKLLTISNKKTLTMDNSIQIDVRQIDREKNLCTCYLYTERNTRATKMFISADSYDSLKRAGFFIRPTEHPDSADVLNTTNMYYGGEVKNENS